jgi:peptide/nickel transport system substrate-binding protein
MAAKKLAASARSDRKNVKSRFVGVLITAVVLIGAWLFLRSGSAPARDEGPAPAARGGQIVASIRAEPRTFNRFAARDQTTELISILTQGRLVRVNPATFALEPWLAEKWESSADGRVHTMHLRPGVTWSDGTPLTADDVVFSVKAVFDPKAGTVLAEALTVNGKPIRAAASDPATVVITYEGPSGSGVRLLGNLPILPRHKLENALDSGSFSAAWSTKTPPSDIVGTGPFVVQDYQPGQRVVFQRNPRYWRKAADGAALPYVDRLVLEVVPEQNAELLRLQSGALDLTSAELRPEEFVTVRRAEQQGSLKMIELGVSTDADALWFCLKPEAKKTDPRFAFVQKKEFRQALSHAVDRETFAETVFLGAAVPVWGPVTPGNKEWFWPDVPRYPHGAERARALLDSIGLTDRNGNGVVEDAAGTEARFTVITQQGLGYYERGLAVVRDDAAKVGIALDPAPLEFGAMIQRMLACNYDAVYMRVLGTDLDPAGQLDYWLSSGSAHVWNLEQKTPATEWEKRIDTIMLEQTATADAARRRQLFNDVQRIFAENLPALYFAAPRMYGAHSVRLNGVVPSVLRPNVLWNADMLSVRPR